MILSPNWPCTQNKATLTGNFHSLSRKCYFLQTTSNIAKLYTVGNHFLSWVWIWDRYVKIRLSLIRINLDSLCLHRNTCQQSGHFRRKMRTPLWRGDCANHETAFDDHKKWPMTADPLPGKCSLPHTPPPGQTPGSRPLASWGRVSAPANLEWPARGAKRWRHSGFLMESWGREGGRKDRARGRRDKEEKKEKEKEKEKGKKSEWAMCHPLSGGFFNFSKSKIWSLIFLKFRKSANPQLGE